MAIFTSPHPPTPSRKGRGSKCPNSRPPCGKGSPPSPCGRGLGGGGGRNKNRTSFSLKYMAIFISPVPVCKERTVYGPFHFFTDTLKFRFVQPPVQFFLTTTFSDSLTTLQKTFCTAVRVARFYIKDAQNSLSIVEPVASNGRI